MRKAVASQAQSDTRFEILSDMKIWFSQTKVLLLSLQTKTRHDKAICGGSGGDVCFKYSCSKFLALIYGNIKDGVLVGSQIKN
jgi:hypothetical protein